MVFNVLRSVNSPETRKNGNMSKEMSKDVKEIAHESSEHVMGGSFVGSIVGRLVGDSCGVFSTVLNASSPNAPRRDGTIADENIT